MSMTHSLTYFLRLERSVTPEAFPFLHFVFWALLKSFPSPWPFSSKVSLREKKKKEKMKKKFICLIKIHFLWRPMKSIQVSGMLFSISTSMFLLMGCIIIFKAHSNLAVFSVYRPMSVHSNDIIVVIFWFCFTLIGILFFTLPTNMTHFKWYHCVMLRFNFGLHQDLILFPTNSYDIFYVISLFYRWFNLYLIPFTLLISIASVKWYHFVIIRLCFSSIWILSSLLSQYIVSFKWSYCVHVWFYFGSTRFLYSLPLQII